MAKKDKSLKKLNYIELRIEGLTLDDKIDNIRDKIERAYVLKLAKLLESVTTKDASSIVKYSLLARQLKRDKERYERELVEQLVLLDEGESKIEIEEDSELSSFLAEDK